MASLATTTQPVATEVGKVLGAFPGVCRATDHFEVTPQESP
jgi:hypothetical protein